MRTITPRAGGIAGALCIASLASAAEPARAEIPMSLSDASPAHGQATTASGLAGRSLSGRRVVLELLAPGGRAWQALGAGAVGPDGRYRVKGRVPRSGAVRLRLPGTAEASAARRVRVTARLVIGHRRLDVVAGRRATVRGSTRPRVAGLAVALQVRRGGRWSTIDRARTRSGGRFSLSSRRRSTASLPSRVRVSGVRAGVRSSAQATGRLDVYRRANASWYGPGLYGNHLGCGGRLGTGTLGVAHKTLPCGTPVTLRKGPRSVRVRVIDRGPYVGGREYDLTAATAQRLGFSGHGPVLVTR